MGRVEGKVALVTGGASGLGEAIVRRLAIEGATVIVADLNEPAAGGADFIRLDFTDEAQWAYCASKGGVHTDSKSAALSCAEQRVAVRVNSVHRGFIDTPLLRKALTRFGDPVEARRQYDALQPLGHIGEPDDVAWGVLYLAGDESKFVTGSALVIDGGYTAR